MAWILTQYEKHYARQSQYSKYEAEESFYRRKIAAFRQAFSANNARAVKVMLKAGICDKPYHSILSEARHKRYWKSHGYECKIPNENIPQLISDYAQEKGWSNAIK